jgi:hypothetical protein
MNLIPGSYEAILTHRLQEALQGLDHAWSHQVEKLESAEAADRLALHLSRVIEKVLSAMPSDQRVTAGSKLVGELIVQALQGRLESLSGEVPSQAGELLMQVARRLPDGSAPKLQSPVVPLLDTALMTNAPGEPRLGVQLISEIPSADSIDLIMAFIRRSGIAPMRDAVRRAALPGSPALQGFDASCFDGIYITGDVTAEDISRLNQQRVASEEDSDDNSRLALPNAHV